jgi:hypothetical protein
MQVNTMGQGVRDGQWYGRPKQEGGPIAALMMFVFFIIGTWGGFGIIILFADTPLDVLGVIIGLV